MKIKKIRRKGGVNVNMNVSDVSDHCIYIDT